MKPPPPALVLILDTNKQRTKTTDQPGAEPGFGHRGGEAKLEKKYRFIAIEYRHVVVTFELVI